MNRRELLNLKYFKTWKIYLEDETRPLRGAIGLILAPSNLGLRPTENGGQPGAWRAPQVLMDAGLADAVSTTDVLSLKRPAYELEAQFGTAIRNGLSIRAFSLELGEKSARCSSQDSFRL